MKYSVLLSNISSLDEAKKLARRLVEARAVACVNIIPGILSIYEWKGKVETEEEFMMLCKTSSERVPEAIRLIEELHPYDVPEIIELEMGRGLPAYLEWLDGVVSIGRKDDSPEG